MFERSYTREIKAIIAPVASKNKKAMVVSSASPQVAASDRSGRRSK
jgi:hypothetical protein